jgi:hypothetical protein
MDLPVVGLMGGTVVKPAVAVFFDIELISMESLPAAAPDREDSRSGRATTVKASRGSTGCRC